MTLTEFLLARIAEDEAAAERAGSHNGRGTFANDNYGCLLVQPARVLAECRFKRAIVERYVAAIERARLAKGRDYFAIDPIIHNLAAVYSDHPDYDETWRP